MNKMAAFFTGTACALALTMNVANAKENDELVFMNWGPYINSDILEEFTKETGIKVIYSTYESRFVLCLVCSLWYLKFFDSNHRYAVKYINLCAVCNELIRWKINIT